MQICMFRDYRKTLHSPTWKLFLIAMDASLHQGSSLTQWQVVQLLYSMLLLSDVVFIFQYHDFINIVILKDKIICFRTVDICLLALVLKIPNYSKSSMKFYFQIRNQNLKVNYVYQLKPIISILLLYQLNFCLFLYNFPFL